MYRKPSLTIPFAGAVVWLAVLFAQSLVAGADLISALLAAGPLVIVPLAAGLLVSRRRRGRLTAERTCIERWSLPPAALLAVAVALPPGTTAGLLAAPWSIYAILLAALALTEALADRRDATSPMAASDAPASSIAVAAGSLAATLFLAVGGAWAVASCAAWTPGGFEEPIVRLTAVHFHHAGFALPAIAVHVAATRRSRVADAAVLGVIIGMPLVAAAITSRSTTAELAATLLIAAAATALAALQLRAALAAAKTPAARTAASLLVISAVSLVTAMTLAVVYAAGRFAGSPILDIPQMAATHGLLNAVGFTLCGLLGWIKKSTPIA